MKRTAITGGLLLAAAMGLLLFGSLRLLGLRFDLGDVYPEWSSMRSDPRGTRAFYEAIELLPGVRAMRLDRPLQEVAQPEGTLLLRIGRAGGKPDELRSFVLRGGRLAVALEGLSPDEARRERRRAGRMAPPDATNACGELAPCAGAMGQGGVTDDWPLGAVVGGGLWGVEVLAATNGIGASMVARGPGLEPMPWGSALYFAPLESNVWCTLMSVAERPAIIERQYGRGTILLASDAYFLSNEAMLRARRPALLARLLGGARSVYFDETIHGMRERRNIAWLLRRYRLQGVGAVLLALAALYLWHCAAPLLPRLGAGGEDDEGALVARGFEARAGHVALLRRIVPDARLLRACVETWDGGAGAALSGDARALVRRVLEEEEAKPPRGRDPVAAWRRIAAIVRNKGSKRYGNG